MKTKTIQNTKKTRQVFLLNAALLLALITGIAGCSSAHTLGPACAGRRLDSAIAYYEGAKTQLSRHFQSHSDTALVHAFYASQDSIIEARGVPECLDAGIGSKRIARKVLLANRYIRGVIVSNLRDSDPGILISIFGSRYRSLFKNDIR